MVVSYFFKNFLIIGHHSLLFSFKIIIWLPLSQPGCELPSTRSRDVTRRSSLDVKPPSSLTSVFTLLVPPQGQAKHHPLLRLLFIYICTLPCFDNKQRRLHSLFIAHEIHNSELYFRSNNSLSAQLLVAQITAASLPAVLL